MSTVCGHIDRIAAVVPSGDGCKECLEIGGRWLHLRLCMECGQVGCCDSSPNRHASKHAAADDHPVARSFEPREEWFWCYVDDVGFEIPELNPGPFHGDGGPRQPTG
jgi:uncharacterized UBP type Zn finger protein